MSSRCAACKYLRRRCPPDCIFSPYFPSNDPQRFACVHRIYGASNVGKVIQQTPTQMRAQVADSLYFESRCRIQDPVYGCAGIISRLHLQIHNVESELAKVKAQIAFLKSDADQEPSIRPQLEGDSSFNNLWTGESSVGRHLTGSSTTHGPLSFM
ncbi:LOB domain-containing protein [Psidium guajava]|nr:LOB domain-containing protein [Psidium guajava]